MLCWPRQFFTSAPCGLPRSRRRSRPQDFLYGMRHSLQQRDTEPVPTTRRLAWLPYASAEEAERRLGGLPDGIEVDVYRADGDSWPDSIADVEFYVLPYLKGEEVLDRVEEMKHLKVIQTLTAGVENFLPHVPEGVILCNAAGVHDTSTSELAVALPLASGR